jgi:hypothetical protein
MYKPSPLLYLQLDRSELENDAISLFKKIAKSFTSFLYHYNTSNEDAGEIFIPSLKIATLCFILLMFVAKINSIKLDW